VRIPIGKIHIIIGTQVVAKGIDLPKLNTVGVVQADTKFISTRLYFRRESISAIISGYWSSW